jgi:ParB-like chromosome segregation protein Spo0J
LGEKKPPDEPDLSHILPALRPFAVRCDSLNFDADNALIHGDEDLDAIGGSIEEFQQDQPIVVQAEGRIVRKGNGRLKAVMRAGKEYIAAIIIEEEDARAEARALADNQSGRIAPWDDKVVARLLERIKGLKVNPKLGTMFARMRKDLTRTPRTPAAPPADGPTTQTVTTCPECGHQWTAAE